MTKDQVAVDSEVIPGRPPTYEEAESIGIASRYWTEVGVQAPVRSIERTESAAKQLIGLTGALQAIYVAIFALSGFQKPGQPPIALVFILPAFLWFLSLLFASLVLVPRVRVGANLHDVAPNAWQDIRNTYEKIEAKKLTLLHWAHGFLVVSFAAALVLVTILVWRTNGSALLPQFSWPWNWP